MGLLICTFINSNAGKVTTNAHSQGIRFLTEITGLRSQDLFLMLIVIPWDFLLRYFYLWIAGKMGSKNTNKESKMPKQPVNISEKRWIMHWIFYQSLWYSNHWCLLSMLLKVHLSFLRKSSTMKAESSVMRNQQLEAKRNKTEQRGQGVVDKTKQNTGKLIELDFVSSDEELWVSFVKIQFLGGCNSIYGR